MEEPPATDVPVLPAHVQQQVQLETGAPPLQFVAFVDKMFMSKVHLETGAPPPLQFLYFVDKVFSNKFNLKQVHHLSSFYNLWTKCSATSST